MSAKTSLSLLLASLLIALGAGAPAALSAPPDRSAPPAPGPVRPFTIPQPEELRLENGLRVLLIERKRAPLVDVIATVSAGLAADPPALPGLASWTANMLTEGAGDLDAIAFADATASLGARISAHAQAESATVRLHSTTTRFAEAAKLFALALTAPRFTEEDWRRQRQQTLGYFTYQAQDPQQLAALAASRAAWGPEHRFGVNGAGTPESLLRAKPSDLRAFHTARYRPDTTTLIVVGDIDKASLTKVLTDTLGAWRASGPRPAPVVLAAPSAMPDKRIVTLHVPGAAQTVLRFVSPAAADIEPYHPGIEVMNTILGGSFTSRLNTNLREEHGYAYGAGSHLSLLRAGNVFGVSTSVATPVTAAAVKEILGELSRMSEPPTDEEVARARTLTALSLPSSFDSGASTAQVWADVVARDIEPARLLRFTTEAQAVDAQAVQQAARRAVNPERFVVVAVGDMRAVGQELTQIAPTSTLTVEQLLPGLQAAIRGEKP